MSLRFISIAVGLVCVVPAAHAGSRSLRAAAVQPLGIQTSEATDYKMDAALRMVVDHVRAGAALGLGFQAGAALVHPASPLRLDGAASGEAEASVFIRLDRETDARELVTQGARILLQRGDLVLARMPISRIESVARVPAIRAMSLSKRWSAALDSSRIRSGVKAVHQGGGALPQAYEGDGVIVGVLDSGLDYTHADFRDDMDRSRLHALFDFSQGTNGTECRKGQLDSLTCTEIDGTGAHGHGTHVTGIAAGDGSVNSQYVGMAPHADLLFVKGIRDAQSNGGFTEADIVVGTAWMLDKAAAAGQPIAINLSLGGQIGAHDGTSLQEQFLDRFVGPGRIIVAAGGNSGGDPIHVSYAVEGTDYATALESGMLLTNHIAIVDLWAPPSSNISVGLAAYDPSDLGTPVFVSNAAAPGQRVAGIATSGGISIGNLIIDARTTADPNNGARNVLVQIAPAPGGFDPGQLVWSIYTSGTGTFDMWSSGGAFFLPPSIPAPAYFRAGDSDKTIGIPGTAKRIVCVGSHVSKTQWIDIDNVTRTQPNATLDAISGFSSHGPSRDGRILPNFTAPGEAIISALSKDYPADRPLTAQGGGYQEQQGTSQASPHVTGIVALMLQREPALTPENARAILQQTAAPAGGSVPNNIFGAGRVRALAALEATPDPIGCTILLPGNRQIPCYELAGRPLSLMAYPNPARRGMRLTFVSPTRERVHLALYDLGGRRVRTLRDGEVAAGVLNASWDGDDDHGRMLPNGVYFAKLRTAGAARSIRLVLAR